VNTLVVIRWLLTVCTACVDYSTLCTVLCLTACFIVWRLRIWEMMTGVCRSCLNEHML